MRSHHKTMPATAHVPTRELRNPHSEKSLLFDKLTSIFHQPKEDRTERDAEIALKALKEVPFFSTMQRSEHELEQLIMDTYSAMGYEVFDEGEAIFHCRDKGDKFYIVLKGSVDIYIPKADDEVKQDFQEIGSLLDQGLQESTRKESRKESIDVKEFAERSKTRLNTKIATVLIPAHGPAIDIQTIVKLKKAAQFLASKKGGNKQSEMEAIERLLNFPDRLHLYFDEFVCKFKKIRTMGAGSNFGELALTGNYPRGATVIAASNVHVATLSKQDYNRVFEDLQKNLKEKMNFFSKLTGQNTGEALTKFSYSFKERHYKYGQKIFSQGDMPHEAFVIKQGEVQITTSEVQEKGSGSEPSFMLKRKKMTERKIVNLGAFSLIGEVEALEDKAYTTTATSGTNETVIYVIPMDEFRGLKLKYGRVFQKILDHHQTKVAYRETRAENTSTVKKLMLEEYENLVNDKAPKTPFGQSLSNKHSPRFIDIKGTLPVTPSLYYKDARINTTEGESPSLPSARSIETKNLKPSMLKTQYTQNLQGQSGEINSAKTATSKYVVEYGLKNPKEDEVMSPSFFSEYNTNSATKKSLKKGVTRNGSESKNGTSSPSPRKNGSPRNSDQEKLSFSQVPDLIAATGTPKMMKSGQEANDPNNFDLPNFFQKFVNDTFRDLGKPGGVRGKSMTRELRPYEIDILKGKGKKKDMLSLFKKNNLSKPSQLALSYGKTSDIKREVLGLKGKIEENISLKAKSGYLYQECLNVLPVNRQQSPKSPKSPKTPSESDKRSLTVRIPVINTWAKMQEASAPRTRESQPKLQQLNLADLELGAPFCKRKTPFSLSFYNVSSTR